VQRERRREAKAAAAAGHRQALWWVAAAVMMTAGPASGARADLPPAIVQPSDPPQPLELVQFIQAFVAGAKAAGAPTEGTSPDVLGAEWVGQAHKQLDDAGRPPVVLVPPLSGVQLDMRLDFPKHLPHWWCNRWQPWTLAWLNPLQVRIFLLPFLEKASLGAPVSSHCPSPFPCPCRFRSFCQGCLTASCPLFVKCVTPRAAAPAPRARLFVPGQALVQR